MENSYFSVEIDEGTDLATKLKMALMLLYCDTKQTANKLVSLIWWLSKIRVQLGILVFFYDSISDLNNF